MRLLCTTTDKVIIRAVAVAFKEKNITHNIEGRTNCDWGSENYGDTSFEIWVIEEAQYETAKKLFENIITNSELRQKYFACSQEPPYSGVQDDNFTKKAMHTHERRLPQWSTHPLTISLIVIQSLVYLLQILFPAERILISSQANTERFVYTHRSMLEKAFLYDYPLAWQLHDSVVSQLHAAEEDESFHGQLYILTTQLKHASKTPYWKGLYYYCQSKNELLNSVQTPRFEKCIHEQQLWRLITPSFLHGSFLHFIFNTMWALILLPIAEELLCRKAYGSLYFLALIFMLSIISNTAQYIVGGANFVGFSGVIAGIAGYLFSIRSTLEDEYKQKLDINSLTFLRAFIYGSACFSLLNFLLVIFGASTYAISLQIANTAHLCGWWAGQIIAIQQNVLLRK